MSRDQKKLEKKKKREREKKAKVKRIREAIRSKAREEKAEARQERRVDKLVRKMADFQYLERERVKELDEDTLAQLEKNASILRALEAEYAKEMEEKQDLNQALEAQGAFTLEDKIALLQQNMGDDQIADLEELGISGDAECRMQAQDRAAGMSADVGVVKAPTKEVEEDEI